MSYNWTPSQSNYLNYSMMSGNYAAPKQDSGQAEKSAKILLDSQNDNGVSFSFKFTF